MTSRQAVGVVLLALAGQAGVRQVGGPTAPPAAPPAPIVVATPPTRPFPTTPATIPAPAPPRPPVVAGSVEWYPAAARRECDRLHPPPG